MTTDSNKQGDDGRDDVPASGGSSDGPSEFRIGLVTFIIFLIFMAIWMYFRTAE